MGLPKTGIISYCATLQHRNSWRRSCDLLAEKKRQGGNDSHRVKSTRKFGPQNCSHSWLSKLRFPLVLSNSQSVSRPVLLRPHLGLPTNWAALNRQRLPGSGPSTITAIVPTPKRILNFKGITFLSCVPTFITWPRGAISERGTRPMI